MVVLFGSTASQFLMCAVTNHHLSKFGNKISETLRNGIYADKIQFACLDENELEEFYIKYMEIMHSANFTLHQWATNSLAYFDFFTKNKILHLSSKIFDPLGWLLPVTIRTCMFLKNL